MDYHYNKTKACEKLGIRLIHAYEDDLTEPRRWEIMKNIILNSCGKSSKLFERKLSIQCSETNKYRDFFDNNSLRGYQDGDLIEALIDEKTKIPYLAFCLEILYKNNEAVDLGVKSCCHLCNYTVIGGLSKLIYHLFNSNDLQKYLNKKDLKVNNIYFRVDESLFLYHNKTNYKIDFLEHYPEIWKFYYRESRRNCINSMGELENFVNDQIDATGYKPLIVSTSGYSTFCIHNKNLL